MVEPETIAGSTQPTVLTSGFRATRTGYLSSSRQYAKPFARAVMTYCLRISSSRFARMTRIIPAVPDVPMTITGIHRCHSRSTNRANDQLAFWNSGENSPPALTPNTV